MESAGHTATVMGRAGYTDSERRAGYILYSYWWDKAIVGKSRVYSYTDGKQQEIQLLVGKAGIQLVMGRSDYKAVGPGREGYTAMGGKSRLYSYCWKEKGRYTAIGWEEYTVCTARLAYTTRYWAYKRVRIQ